LLVLNAIIVALTAAILLVASARYARDARSETLGAASYFTTEWRLLRQLKESTDKALSDKDAEIAELRERYRSLQRSGASANLLRSIDEAIREAEESRAVILSARVSAYEADGRQADAGAEGDDGAPSSGAVAAALTAIAAVESSRSATAVAGSGIDSGQAAIPPARPAASPAELLHERIRGLEASLAAEATRADRAEREILALRSALAEARAFDAFYRESPSSQPTAPATVPSSAPSSAASGRADEPAREPSSALAVALAAELERLSSSEPAIGLAELRTRALLRAIVRAPAIRAEYPELLESLDTYLERVDQDAYLRGRITAYEALLERIGASRK